MKSRVAYLGLGGMGAAMVKRLLDAGFPVSVWNRSPGKADDLVALGARSVRHPADAVDDADVVFTMVSDDRALDEITNGECGFLHAMKPGAVHGSMSTILPATAERMALAHQARGVSYVAAPVFGRPAAAAEGALWICLSGAAEDKDRLLPVIAPLCVRHFDFGVLPAAANVVKLAGNFMIAAAIESMAEAFVLAEKNGISANVLVDFFGETMFSCPIYKNYGRLIAEARFSPPGFRSVLGRKDVQLVAEMARASDVPMPFLGSLLDRFAARIAKGGGELDWTSIALDVAADAGIVRP